MPEAVLALEGLTAGYDEAAVIRDLDLSVVPGEVVALLGANGAGKTTTLRAVSGIVRPMGGRVLFEGEDLARSSPSARARARDRARARGPRPLLRADGRRALPARASATSGSTRSSPTSTSRSCAELPRAPRRPALRRRAADARRRPGRSRRKPKLLLLDELSLGLAPVIVEWLLPVVRQFAAGAAAARCCSWSSTCTWRSRSPTAATSFPTAGSCSRTTRSTCGPTGTC